MASENNYFLEAFAAGIDGGRYNNVLAVNAEWYLIFILAKDRFSECMNQPVSQRVNGEQRNL
jgi:hypothetical protein